MRPTTNEPDTDSDDLTAEFLAGLATTAGLLLFAPVVLAWHAAGLAAEHPRMWRWHISAHWSRHLVGIAGVALALTGLVVVVSGPTPAAKAIGLCGVCAGLSLAVTVPVLRWRMSHWATVLHNGRVRPERADLIRHAMWVGAGDAAWERRRSAPPQAIGCLYHLDRRDWLTRWRDSRGKEVTSHWRRAPDFLTLDTDPYRAVVLAESGAGKTNLLLSLVRQTLRQDGSAVFVNAKGDTDTRDDLHSLAASLGLPCREWRVGASCPAPFDAWRGDSDAIITKLGALFGGNPADPGDTANFYRQEAQAVLRVLASTRTQPWTSAAQVLNDAQEAARRPGSFGLGKRQAERTYEDLLRVLGGQGKAIDGGRNSWCWEDLITGPGLTIVQVEPSNQNSIQAVVLMLTDLDQMKHGQRATHARSQTSQAGPRLLVMDEAAVLLNNPTTPPIAALYEQLRSAGLSVVLAAQSVAGLGDTQQGRLLDAGAVYFIGRLRSPEDITSRIGTRKRAEYAHNGGDFTDGGGSAREQDGWLLDPQHIRSLRNGHWAISEYGGKGAYFAATRDPDKT